MSESSVVDFGGEEFAVADKIGQMAFLRFAHVAQGGVDSSDLEGLAAMYDLLEQVIAPGEWGRFQATALKTRADGDELMAVVKQVVTGQTRRPTGPASDSSDGPVSTKRKSAGGSSSRVARRLEKEGRPDLALMVELAQEARSAA